MLFEKRSFSQECRVKMSPVIDLIEETLDNRSKIVGELMEDCLALKCDNMLAQGQSLFDGKVFDTELLTPRRENLQRYRQLRVKVELHSKSLVDIRDTTLRYFALLCPEDTLDKFLQDDQCEPVSDVHSPAQQLMTGIDNLIEQLAEDRRQLNAMQQVLFKEIHRANKQRLEQLRPMCS